ncbi:MAG: hypothetical protein ACKO2P_09680 [Planctomycetota bacterium]
MLNGATALFTWTLRMDARYVYPHMVRAAFAMFILFCLSMAELDAFGTNRTGLVFFELVCQLNVLMIAAAGVSYFVTAVSEEKDAGTFALLQLAGLTPLAITLGKSTSRLVSSLMLLVSQMPFTFLAVTLGGIRWQQVLGAWVCLAAWMILVANMALLCSARCRDSARAAGAAGILLLLWFGTPPALRQLLTVLAPGTLPAPVEQTLARIPKLLEIVSPWQQLDAILNSWESAEVFGGQFWASLLLAGTCFAVSTWRLNAWTRPTEDGAAGQEQGGKRRWPVSRCWRFPLAWRDFHFFAGGRTIFIGRWLGWLLVYAAFTAIQNLDNNAWSWLLTGHFALQLLMLLAGALSLECVLLATGSLHSELRQMTHSSLAMLPLSSVRVILEKSAGCGLSVLPTAVWLATVWILGGWDLTQRIDGNLVLTWLLLLIFSTHVAALFSLYSRWAAFPLTVLATFVAFFVIAGPILLIPATVGVLARTHNIRNSLPLAWAITIFWTWVLLILPIQVWIRERWLVMVRK